MAKTPNDDDNETEDDQYVSPFDKIADEVEARIADGDDNETEDNQYVSPFDKIADEVETRIADDNEDEDSKKFDPLADLKGL
ncbi:hypothetical protein [Natronosalvus halobius]|uniref:hypothetical protein n=1 Tax=Natronosalvus halobius TaxID=2953746 RepID=UPI00209D3E31|nr:hypothetical protein [Natronosalvus halobius]USZ71265.1 hypothetical protein NGM15_14450 [Natronosalvus halobius]